MPAGGVDRAHDQRGGRAHVPLRAEELGVRRGDHPVARTGGGDVVRGPGGAVPGVRVAGGDGAERAPQLAEASSQRRGVVALGRGEGRVDDGVLRGGHGQAPLDLEAGDDLARRPQHLVGRRGRGGVGRRPVGGRRPGLAAHHEHHLGPATDHVLRRSREQRLLEHAELGHHRAGRGAQALGQEAARVLGAPGALGHEHQVHHGPEVRSALEGPTGGRLHQVDGSGGAVVVVHHPPPGQDREAGVDGHGRTLPAR